MNGYQKQIVYGEIDGFEGVYATAMQLEDCRNELRSTLEDWLLLSIHRNLPIPEVNGLSLQIRDVAWCYRSLYFPFDAIDNLILKHSLPIAIPKSGWHWSEVTNCNNSLFSEGYFLSSRFACRSKTAMDFTL